MSYVTVTVINPSGWGLDDLYIGIPEPASLALLGLALVTLASATPTGAADPKPATNDFIVRAPASEIDAIADAVEQRRQASEQQEAELMEGAQEEEAAIAGCSGIRIYSAVAYDVGGQTFTISYAAGSGSNERSGCPTPRSMMSSDRLS